MIVCLDKNEDMLYTTTNSNYCIELAWETNNAYFVILSSWPHEQEDDENNMFKRYIVRREKLLKLAYVKIMCSGNREYGKFIEKRQKLKDIEVEVGS